MQYEVLAPLVGLNENNFISCRLPDGIRYLALFNTGSSRTMVGDSLVNRSSFLQSLPVNEMRRWKTNSCV